MLNIQHKNGDNGDDSSSSSSLMFEAFFLVAVLVALKRDF